MGWLVLIVSTATLGAAAKLFLVHSFIWGGILLAFSVYLLIGLMTVQEHERFVIEFFGKYCMTLRPGLQWILFGLMRVRSVIPVWERPIALFEESIKVDFKDGSATPKNAVVFVQLKSPDIPYQVGDGKMKDIPYQVGDGKMKNGTYRATYEISDWKIGVRDLIENALRTYLNQFTIDEALAQSKAGYDLAGPSPEIGLPNHEIDRIKQVLAKWGYDLRRITIKDFDLEPNLVAARGKVQVTKKQAEAAEYEQLKRSRETMGAFIYMLAECVGEKPEDIRKEIEDNEELRKEMIKFAQELIVRQMSLNAKALTDIRVNGGKELERSLLRAIALFKSKDKPGKKEEDKEREDKKE